MNALAIPMRTVVGLFDDRNEAMRAYTALVDEGYAKAARNTRIGTRKE